MGRRGTAPRIVNLGKTGPSNTSRPGRSKPSNVTGNTQRTAGLMGPIAIVDIWIRDLISLPGFERPTVRHLAWLLRVYYIVLHYTIAYYTTLCNTVLYYTVLH